MKTPYPHIRLVALIAILSIAYLSDAHDGEHPATNLSGNWTITFTVDVGGGECESDEGDVTIEETTLTHNVATGEIGIRGVLDDPNETLTGHVSIDGEGDTIFVYEGTFREDGGWTERYVELIIADDWNSMEGFENWEWGYSSNDNASDECPDSRSTLTAVRGGPGAPPVTLAPPVQSFYDTFARAMRLSSEGRRRLDVLERNLPEIFFIMATNPSIGGDLTSVAADLSDSAILYSPRISRHRISHTEVGESGEAGETFDALQPGMTAFILGESDELRISQTKVDQVVSLRDMIYEKASDALKADINTELSELPELVDMSYGDALGSFGIDPANLSIIAYSPKRGQEQFELNTPALKGISYTLWKTYSIDAIEWIQVVDAVIENSENYVTLVDPNPGDLSAFYRIEAVTAPDNSLQ